MHQLNLIPQDGKIYIVKELSRYMKYTVKDLLTDFPDDASCLEWLINYLYPEGITCKSCMKITKHHKVKSRRSYSCDECGHHLHPTAGTIFHNSHIPLTDWFYAMFVMSTNKAGTPAIQISRELNVSYPTAWRMMHQIRKLMEAPVELLSDEVEIDETYIHANSFKRSSARKKYGFDARRTGQVVFGMVQRGGAVKVWHVKSSGVRVLMPLIEKNIKYGSLIHSDGWNAYKTLPRRGFEHRTTNHGIGEYYREDSYTQNIENFWSTWKPRMKGTFKYIGPKYLQAYANEYAWRYTHRKDVNMFWSLMAKITN